MSENIDTGMREYYEDLREMTGDPTAGMDASGNEPITREEMAQLEQPSEQEQA